MNRKIQKALGFTPLTVTLLALSLQSLQASPLETTVELGAGLEHSSNALKTSTGERSELEQQAIAALGLNYESSSVIAELDYITRFTVYDENTQSDQAEITGDASITYEQMDDQLYWTLENNRRNLVRDRALANIQSNREVRAITTIGPELILRPSASDAIYTGLSYSDTSYDDSDQQNSNSTGASISWQRSLSEVDVASVNINYQDVKFDAGLGDNQYYRATIGYSASLSKLSYNIDVGYNTSQRESGDANGGYFQAETIYLSRSSSWRLAGLHELTDTSRGGEVGDFVDIGDFYNSALEVDVFELTYLELEYSNSALCGACLFSAAVLLQSEDYEELDNDSDEYAFGTSLTYQINSLLTGGVLLGYRDFSFKNNNARDDYTIVNVGFEVNQTLTRQFSVVYSLGYEQGDSSASTGDYDELRGGIWIGYVF
jgi:hypothetical protein